MNFHIYLENIKPGDNRHVPELPSGLDPEARQLLTQPTSKYQAGQVAAWC